MTDQQPEDINDEVDISDYIEAVERDYQSRIALLEVLFEYQLSKSARLITELEAERSVRKRLAARLTQHCSTIVENRANIDHDVLSASDALDRRSKP